MKNLSRKNRRNQTKAESVFWEAVRNRKLQNLKFRRQHVIGKYIVDFYCPEKKLIVEIDGGYHRERQEEDALRDKTLKEAGYQILRFTNEQVEDSLESILDSIIAVLK